MDRTVGVRLASRVSMMMTNDRAGTAWTARIAVRIPRDGGSDIATDATRRLQRVPGIESVEIAELCGIEPTLAATVARFEVRLSTAETTTSNGVSELLQQAAGTERVEGVETAE